jgi:superfamily II DNA/RNA helicase
VQGKRWVVSKTKSRTRIKTVKNLSRRERYLDRTSDPHNVNTILFLKTKPCVNRLCARLARAGVPVGALRGGKLQVVRTRTLAMLKDSANAALVATDVAQRGIHVDGISLIVQVEFHKITRITFTAQSAKRVLVNQVSS